MRAAVVLVVLALVVCVNSCRHSASQPPPPVVSAPAPAAEVPPVTAPAQAAVPELATPAIAAANSADQKNTDFDSTVRPILEARCQPCHFPGGVMYERRPFDRPETITALGTKLFTRLKDEDEQKVIREFLARQSQ